MLIYLGDHFREAVTVEEAAGICCLTPTYFCYLFKKTTGKTFIEYLHMLRIHEATRLLRLRRYSVQAVSDQVGFSNPTYFGRVFKSITGMTPSQYAARFP
ncbi:Bifunctional transcriptional activator/DNA repair enzyme AdaA [compost metagenome]